MSNLLFSNRLIMLKKPCMHWRVEDEGDYPFYDVDHEVSAYPRHYTPLWYPELFPEVFSHMNSIVGWLNDEFSCVSPGWIVEPGVNEIVVRSDLGFCPPFTLSLEEIASESFYPPFVIKYRCDQADDTPVSLRDINPSWLFLSDSHRKDSIQYLTVDALKDMMRYMKLVFTYKMKKCDLIDTIVNAVQDVAEATASRTLSSLQAMSAYLRDPAAISIPDTPFYRSRSAMAACIFEHAFGKQLATRMRVPRSDVLYSEAATMKSSVIIDDLYGGIPASSQIAALAKLSRRTLSACISQIHPQRRRLNWVAETQKDLSTVIIRSMRDRCCEMDNMSLYVLRDCLLSWEPEFCFEDALSPTYCARLILLHEYGRQVTETLMALKPRLYDKNERQRQLRSLIHSSDAIEANEKYMKYAAAWPQLVSEGLKHRCLNDYVEAMKFVEPPTCAVCSRMKESLRYHLIKSESSDFQSLNLDLLKVNRSDIEAIMVQSKDTQHWDLKPLYRTMLDREGIDRHDDGSFALNICGDCHTSLVGSKVPKYSMMNGLYRGRIPEEFEDLTWVEEMVCCKHINVAYVTKLKEGHSNHAAKILIGNTCAHEMKVVSTAKALPRTPSDVNDMISVVFMGPKIPTAEQLGDPFVVRRNKVWRFLMWLKDNNELYSDIAMDRDIIDMYPDSGVLPGLPERIIHNEMSVADSDKIFNHETASLAGHPFQLVVEAKESLISDEIIMEKTGVSDADQTELPAKYVVSSGLHNLIKKQNGLEIPRSFKALPEYGNPSLFPGMYPTLFPYGIGGFELPKRHTKISLRAQTEYLFDIKDRRFRYHYSFIFVVLNIIQRRMGHLHTHFTVRKHSFKKVADALNGLRSEAIERLAKAVETEGRPKNLTQEEKDAMVLLRHVNSIATSVPGSSASKTLCRNEIRSYVGAMGAPQIFLTINPTPQHHPVFLLMCGDKTINLNERYPEILVGRERARLLAKDPVAAADFFDRSIRCIFAHLFGWDYNKGQSTSEGGILGMLKAFYGTAEYTERGVLHGHFLIWLEGGINPAEVHERMRTDESFKSRFFDFFDDIIKHDLPTKPLPDGFSKRKYFPGTEMPPMPLPVVGSSLNPDMTQEEYDNWHRVFASEVKLCGEAFQRHECLDVCFKYGSGDKCRFRFPHDVVEKSYFDPEDNAIYLQCKDPMVNYYNPLIMVYCRHNHDIKCILSGRSAKAAMFYITDYITKSSLKTSQILSTLCRAVMVAPKSGEKTPVENAKTLLHKCLSQFTRRQQIHAQQAARYLRKNTDAMSSHKTVPMMSNMSYAFLKRRHANKLTETDLKPTVVSIGIEDPQLDPHQDIVSSEETDNDQSDSEISEEEDFESRLNQLDDTVADPTSILYKKPEAHNPLVGPPIDEPDMEQVTLQVTVDEESGKIVHSSQLDDYIYRSPLLKNMCFFDFVSLFDKEKKTAGVTSQRTNVKKRYPLQEKHPLSSTHELVERYLVDEVNAAKIYSINRVVGMSIPRARQADKYPLFLMSHFVPFSDDHDPVPEGQCIDQFVNSYKFSDDHKVIMKNWDVIYECEDARDAERLALHEKSMRKMRDDLNEKFKSNNDGDGFLELTADNGTDFSIEDPLVEANVVRWLRYAKYFEPDGSVDHQKVIRELESHGCEMEDDKWMQSALKKWDAEIKLQQTRIQAARINDLDQENQTMRLGRADDDIMETVVGCSLTGAENNEAKGKSKTQIILDNDKSDAIPDTKVNIVDGVSSLDAANPSDVMKIISRKHHLNDKQNMAFVIASTAWHNVYVKSKSSRHDIDYSASNDIIEPLRLLMTGPGGTGKSHSIKALKEYMEYYGSGNRLRLLAPTGSAAALIDGMTVHRGLSLKVRAKKKGKHGVSRSDINNGYEMEITTKQMGLMREAWKDIDVVLIDEVSVLSLQDLTDVDHALRMAKEKPNEWFGGIIVIFSGDFYQFPPVGGSSLFTCIRNTFKTDENELKKRLGRLAWKTLNAVVEFDEQFRMKDDPEYSDAVGRLRTRTCTQKDVDLFNSRVIKSVHNPNGVDMSVGGNSQATAIVATNNVRHSINEAKAVSICSTSSSPRLIECYAEDLIGRRLVPVMEHKDFRKSIIELGTSNYSSEGALPGKLSLFEGMPVILRGRNLAVDLKIANGSQGYVYRVETVKDEYGYNCARVALVYFPNSPVHLTGLPRGVYPIKPVSWSFASAMDIKPGVLEKYVIRRSQLPIQPGFAVTGNSAQGKTLDKVLCSLKEREYSAYVSASRARRREDLYLTGFVTLEDLNIPLRDDLVFESRRYTIMEHNTLVKYGFIQGSFKEVPDLEDEHVKPSSTMYVGNSGSLIWNTKDRQNLPKGDGKHPRRGRHQMPPKNTITPVSIESKLAPSKKIQVPTNKIDNIPLNMPSSIKDPATSEGKPSAKRKRDIEEELSLSVSRQRLSPPRSFQGCKWSDVNYSCAYDSVFMSLFSAYINSDTRWRRLWSLYNLGTTDLANAYNVLCHTTSHTPGIDLSRRWDAYRDRMRDYASIMDRARYERWGAVFASAQDLFVTMNTSTEKWSLKLTSRNGHEAHRKHCDHIFRSNLTLDVFNRYEDIDLPLLQRHNHQCWVNSACTLDTQNIWRQTHSDACLEVNVTHYTVEKPPLALWLFHNTQTGRSVLPVPVLLLPSTSGANMYRLVSIIYLGGEHFTARIQFESAIYKYDGRMYDGACIYESDIQFNNLTINQLSDLMTFDGRSAHIFVYVRSLE